jgi:hypothetical protein
VGVLDGEPVVDVELEAALIEVRDVMNQGV